MSRAEVTIKYYDRRMLLSCDLHTLFSVLFREYGEDASVQFAAMTDAERLEASDQIVKRIGDTQECADTGMRAVGDHFQILEAHPGDGLRRRADLERRVIATSRRQIQWGPAPSDGPPKPDQEPSS